MEGGEKPEPAADRAKAAGKDAVATTESSKKKTTGTSEGTLAKDESEAEAHWQGFSIYNMGKMLMMLWIAMTCVNLGQQAYANFYKTQCDVNAPPAKCKHPFFNTSDTVYLRMFLQDEPIWEFAVGGLQEQGRIDLHTEPWNFGEALSASVTIPPQRLADLMEAASTKPWWLHVFVVRNGFDLEHELQKWKEKAKGAIRRYPDGTHFITSNVLYLPSQSPLIDSISPPPEKVDLVDLSTGDSARKEDLRPWCYSLLTGTALLQPSAEVAVIRHTGFAGCGAWLMNQANQANNSAPIHETLLTGQNDRPPVPHVRHAVEMYVADDDRRYIRSPVLFQTVELRKQGMQQRPVPYIVVTRNRTEYFVPAMSIFNASDDEAGRTRNWRLLTKEMTNATSNGTTFQFVIEPVHLLKYCFLATLKQYLQIYKQMGVPMDQVFGQFLSRPLYILVFQQVVSWVKVFLTGLAFKNELSFFRGRTNYQGLSSRSLLWETLSEVILLLYLIDMGDIPQMIIVQFVISTAISAYKFAQVGKMRVQWSHFLPWLVSTRADDANDLERETEEFDAEGMKYVGYVLYPVAALWGGWCLIEYSYKSWWSWLISVLMNFTYSTHFINMLPQLFINYKLKSVAHMPWRVLTLKFFNTFIDDVYAWIVARQYFSLKYRLMTLQDDVVFIVLMYQRYIYRVDYSRPDEFGYVYAEGNPTEQIKEGEKDGEEKGSKEKPDKAEEEKKDKKKD